MSTSTGICSLGVILRELLADAADPDLSAFVGKATREEPESATRRRSR